MALAILNPELFVDQDASSDFEMEPKILDVPLQALGYQFRWDSTVAGTVTYFASVFPSPYNWERLVSCDVVTFHTSDSSTDSMILAIPNLWFSTGFIKFIFVADDGSTGTMDVAERIVPL